MKLIAIGNAWDERLYGTAWVVFNAKTAFFTDTLQWNFWIAVFLNRRVINNTNNFFLNIGNKLIFITILADNAKTIYIKIRHS